MSLFILSPRTVGDTDITGMIFDLYRFIFVLVVVVVVLVVLVVPIVVVVV